MTDTIRVKTRHLIPTRPSRRTSPTPATPATSEVNTNGTTVISSRRRNKLADRVGHLCNGPDQRRRLASEGNPCTAAGRRANRQTDEDPNVQGATTSLHDIVGLVIEIGDDVLFEWLH